MATVIYCQYSIIGDVRQVQNPRSSFAEHGMNTSIYMLRIKFEQLQSISAPQPHFSKVYQQIQEWVLSFRGRHVVGPFTGSKSPHGQQDFQDLTPRLWAVHGAESRLERRFPDCSQTGRILHCQQVAPEAAVWSDSNKMKAVLQSKLTA